MDEEIAVNAVNSSQNNINELFGDDDSASDDEISLESEEVTDFGSQTRSTLEEVGSLNCVDTPSISDGCSKLLYTKLPNVVGIQATPFDNEFYVAEDEQAVFAYTNSLIRWRYKADPSNPGEFLKDSQGKHVPESNSRITTWSDGSKTLTVGSEHFELIDHPTPTNYLMVTQQDATQTILEGVSQVSTKITPRPISLDSAAHKDLAARVRQSNIKKSRIIETVTHKNPELEKEAKARAKDDQARAQKRKKARTGMSMDASYLEDSPGVSLKELRRQANEYNFGDDSDEEEMEEEDNWIERRKSKRGRLDQGRDSDNDDEDEDEDEDDDDDETGRGNDKDGNRDENEGRGGEESSKTKNINAPPTPPTSKQRSAFLGSDDDEDDGVVVKKRKRERTIEDDED